MKKNNKGFTLMEMLIVVAIIGVLVAIMIPTVTANLTKARQATDEANVRSAIAEVSANYLMGSGDLSKTVKAQEACVSGIEIGGLTEGEGFTGWAKGHIITISANSANGKISITSDAASGS